MLTGRPVGWTACQLDGPLAGLLCGLLAEQFAKSGCCFAGGPGRSAPKPAASGNLVVGQAGALKLRTAAGVSRQAGRLAGLRTGRLAWAGWRAATWRAEGWLAGGWLGLAVNATRLWGGWQSQWKRPRDNRRAAWLAVGCFIVRSARGL